MTSYNQTFGGATIYPAQVTYNYLNLSAAQSYQLQWPIDNNTLSNSGTLGSSLIYARILDINCTNAGASLILPSTALSGPGEQTTINNVGTQTVVVKNSAGTTVATIAVGIQYVLYSSSIPASGWYSFQMGAAFSSTSAAAIAGNGLVAVGTQLSQNIPVVSTSTNNYTFGSGDLAKLYVWTGGAGNFNLPGSAASGASYYVQIKNNGSGQLTVTPNGTDTINGVNAALTFNTGDSAFMVTDGLGGWYTVGYGNASNNLFQFLQISLAGLSGTYTISGSALNKIAYRFTGLLAGNIQIVTPSTVQQYWVDNQTTGGFALTIGVSGQVTPVAVATGTRMITYCDGTNVVNAATAGIATPLAIASGGTGAVTAGAALTNLGGTSIGTTIFTAANAGVVQTQSNTLDAGTAVSLSVALG
jgi:hypothetical protein